MAEILPVEDKLKQQEYCLQFGARFDLSLMAYVAFKDGEAVSICQFEISEDVCRIRYLDFAEHIRQTPIPFLLLRAVMHFADGCKVNRIELYAENVGEDVATSAGFARNRHGIYEIDVQNLCP